MFILRDILLPLQDHFSQTDLGRERASLFVYTILSIIVPFTSSMTSNVWRCLDTLFGFEIKNKRFYTFMASTTLPWIGCNGQQKPDTFLCNGQQKPDTFLRHFPIKFSLKL